MGGRGRGGGGGGGPERLIKLCPEQSAVMMAVCVNNAHFFVSVFSFNCQAFHPQTTSEAGYLPSLHLLTLLSCSLPPRCCIVVECSPPSHTVRHNRNSPVPIYTHHQPWQNYQPASQPDQKHPHTGTDCTSCFSGRAHTAGGYRDHFP